MQATLYLMLGYPGSGKTTASKIIHELTGAEHLWADHERRLRFETPTHSQEEHLALYNALNHKAQSLLEEGISVVYDTNFSFFKDREHMRKIAEQADAKTVLVWVHTPKELAKERATQGAHTQGTRVLGDMPEADFERITGNMEAPADNEAYTELDGTKLTESYIKDKLKLV